MSIPTIKELVESKKPAQVMFYDGEDMSAGILFGEQIICGCCGSVFDVYEVVTMAQDDMSSAENAICLFVNWVDVSSEIRGSEADVTTAIPLENGGYV